MIVGNAPDSQNTIEFETRMLTGGDRRGGFTSYASACAHARERTKATGKPHEVRRVARMCIIEPEDG